MKKWWIALIVILLIIGAGVGYYFYTTNTANNNGNYEAEKTATNSNASSEEAKTEENNQEQSDGNATDEQKRAEEEAQKQQAAAAAQATQAQAKSPVESGEIASFSTKIYSKDKARQNNISITCSSLNNTDVANGDTFSFCSTVGQSSSSKGYQKADIYVDGEKTKGYGGGNCQISTTLYNAVLKVPSLKVTERHEHSNDVPYIQNGKDAAVAYGSYDFKFVNNTGHSIRIKAESSADNVTIKLIKLL